MITVNSTSHDPETIPPVLYPLPHPPPGIFGVTQVICIMFCRMDLSERSGVFPGKGSTAVGSRNKGIVACAKVVVHEKVIKAIAEARQVEEKMKLGDGDLRL